MSVVAAGVVLSIVVGASVNVIVVVIAVVAVVDDVAVVVVGGVAVGDDRYRGVCRRVIRP